MSVVVLRHRAAQAFDFGGDRAPGHEQLSNRQHALPSRLDRLCDIAGKNAEPDGNVAHANAGEIRFVGEPAQALGGRLAGRHAAR